MEYIAALANDNPETIRLNGGKVEGLKLLKDLGLNVPDFAYIDPETEITEVSLEALFDELNPDDVNRQWSVRSSANVEDGLNASYAGQFNSVIGVTDREVLEAIEVVRASAGKLHVDQYRELLGEVGEVSVGVIIQRFDEPDISGAWIGN